MTTDTLIDLVNALPDAWRLLWPVLAAIRIIGAANGWTVYEDGSVTP